MPLDPTASPTLVTIGLIDGSSFTAWLDPFDPSQTELSLRPTDATAGQPAQERRVWVDQVCSIGFHHDPDRPLPPLAGPTRPFHVETLGGGSFVVQAEPVGPTDPRGFLAQPGSPASLFERVWFYTHGVRRVEDPSSLGGILVQEGLVDSAELDEICEVHALDREAPLGEILVERNLVAQAEVEAAARRQALWKAGQTARGGRTIRIGEILVEAGLVSPADIEAALQEQAARRGRRLGEILVDNGVVTEEEMARALAAKFRLPFIDLDKLKVNPAALREVPLELVQRFRVLPYATTERTLSVAMADPTTMEAMDILRFSQRKRVLQAVVTVSQLKHYLEPWVAPEETEDGRIERLVDLLLRTEPEAGPATSTGEDPLADGAAPQAAAEGTVVRLVYRIILAARERGASDIHIEPYGPEAAAVVRFRVDGQCEVHRRVSPQLRHNMVARIKILAGLDITERRRPQDGKIRLTIGPDILELRVATIPTAAGNEDVVMRLLAASGTRPMADLGLSPRCMQASRKLLDQPYGLALVVGPTGSGKTTTLHAMLGALNNEHRKIWTAEDPVEITQPGLRQVQVQPAVGLTFAAAMRAFLRADPDVIMVGEMRDLETASTAVEASLTGHLVMSTLHTNNAPETVTRLVDMGLDPFSFSDVLLGVLAQRLVRRLCPHCREPYTTTAAELDELRSLYGPQAEGDGLDLSQNVTLWRAPGCEKCRGKGTLGRLGVHEVLVADEELRQLIQRKAPTALVRDAAIRGGMRTLVQDAIPRCLAGQTSIPLVLAACAR